MPHSHQDGKNPLHYAAAAGHSEIIRILVKDCHVNMNAYSLVSCHTSLCSLCSSVHCSLYSIVHRLCAQEFVLQHTIIHTLYTFHAHRNAIMCKYTLYIVLYTGMLVRSCSPSIITHILYMYITWAMYVHMHTLVPGWHWLRVWSHTGLATVVRDCQWALWLRQTVLILTHSVVAHHWTVVSDISILYECVGDRPLQFNCSHMHSHLPVQTGVMAIHLAANEGRLEALRTLVNDCHCDPEIRDVVSCKHLQRRQL